MRCRSEGKGAMSRMIRWEDAMAVCAEKGFVRRRGEWKQKVGWIAAATNDWRQSSGTT